MKESSLYGHVVELLDSLEELKTPADALVAEFFRTRHYLGARDRRFIAEVVFDVIRNRALLDYIVQTAVPVGSAKTPDRGTLLLCILVAYLVSLRGLPPEEITVSLSPLWSSSPRMGTLESCRESISGSWNALPWPSSSIDRLALQYSIARDVVNEWAARLGPEEATRLCQASNDPPPITVRVNTLQCTREECREGLRLEGIEATPTAFSPVGLVFPKRTNIQSLQAFRRGWFEMQDEGSQLLSYLLEPVAGQNILDACAGAGGKTLQIAALMKNVGSVTATDSSRQRLANLEERRRRAGASIIHVGPNGNQHSESRPMLYDAVLIDAPCSGTGTYRRNPWLKGTYTEEMLAQVIETQRRLLRRYALDVKRGGRLVYATCSLLARENQEQVEAFLRDHREFMLLPAAEILRSIGIRIEDEGRFLELYPHRHGTDGFFGAVLQRVSDSG